MKFIKYVFALLLLSNTLFSCTELEESLEENLEIQTTTGEDEDDPVEPGSNP